MAVGRDDFARDRRRECAVLAFEHAALDLPAAHALFDQYFAVMAERLAQRGLEFLDRVGFADPDRRAEPRRLDE